MKKIVSAVALAAVAASFATAELNSSLNVRMGGSLLTKTMADAGDTMSVLDLGSSDFGGDSITFKASNDYAGVTLNYSVTLQSKETGQNQAKLFWSKGNGAELSAWLKPTDNVKLQVGAHKDGIWTAEQCKKDTDATSWSGAGKYAFLLKPGVSTVVSTGYFLDALTDVGNGGQAYLFADFGLMDGALTVRPTFVSTGVDWLQATDKASDDAVMKTAPGVLVAYKNDAVKFNIDFQMPTNKDIAAGIYVSPLGLMDGALTAMIGGTFSTNLSDAADNLGYKTSDLTITRDTSYYAFDLRLRYAADAFHIANCFNFTGASEDKSVVQKNGSTVTGNMEIWDAVFLTYQLNDKWTVTGDLQIDAVTGVGADDDTYLDLYVTPGLMYTCGSGATITGGIHFNILDASDVAGKTTKVAVPFVLRVKM
ncbi:MAG: hypothetical protein K5873_09595 [Treponema sp.]|nr:hypothetical protein [Treponema sp.]